MGLSFRSSGARASEKSSKSSQEIETFDQEKTSLPADTSGPASRQSTSRVHSSRASIAASVRSSYTEEIKHEVKCNYLYQQQCAKLWINDGSGQTEGVLLKKSRNEYIACPPSLAQSEFASAIALFNVPVLAGLSTYHKPRLTQS